jgi:hypothetical protein
MPKIIDRQVFVNAAVTKFGNISTITRQQVLDVCEEYDIGYPTWLTNDPANRAGRGEYHLPKSIVAVKPAVKPAAVVTPPVIENDSMSIANMTLTVVKLDTDTPVSLIPTKANGYVPFGHFNDVRSIVKSGKFYPVYVTGLSGNGKTMMIEQVCAAEKRELIRVNITIETDEDDLIGGFRLIDGRTVWHNGPVIQAMERGAILLLDEVDLGSNKLMCLQPVLEGNPIFIKKINKKINPVAGFNIIATANTKGKGSDDGRFIGTNVMNEAFLERFSITLEQEYPPAKTESKILNNVLATSNIQDTKFVNLLVQWAEVVRKSFMDGAVSEIISTRRLVHICEAFAIFNQNREKAIQLCLNRFDIDTKNSFMELYKKLDETINPLPKTEPTTHTDEIQF